MDPSLRNQAFIRDLFAGRPVGRHAFVTTPKLLAVHEGPDNDVTTSHRPVSEWVPWVAENHRRLHQRLLAVQDDGVPTARICTGTHIFAQAMGCAVHVFADNNPCAKPLVATAAEADALPEPDLWATPVFERIFELARLVRRELGPDVPLGPCDMQSGFDTACLIWDKTELSMAIADPEGRAAVARLAGKCARLLQAFLAAWRREFPTCSPCHCPMVWTPPELGPWISNDECGAVSPRAFRELIMPELLDLARAWGGLGMHCCAAAEHQFAAFAEIPGFYAFNRVAAKQGYGPILRHFSGPRAPVHVLAWLPDEEIERLAATASPGTRFIFEQAGCTEDHARSWLERMHRLPAHVAQRALA